jgi:hypothetical protein
MIWALVTMMIEDMKAYISRLILANDSDEKALRPKLKFSGFSIQSRLPLVEHQHLSFFCKHLQLEMGLRGGKPGMRVSHGQFAEKHPDLPSNYLKPM